MLIGRTGHLVPLIILASMPPIAARAQSAAPEQVVASPLLDSIASALFALQGAPGMAVAVVRDTQVLLAKGYGWADAERRVPVTAQTIFYIASATKSFTGLAAAQLAARGTISLDAPLARYLPAARLQPPMRADSVTLRSLLSHTHGISNDGPVVIRTAYSGEFTDSQLVALLVDHPPARTGRAYSYGNIGYVVAALAMDAATRTSWKDLLEREIFRPLGMSSTSARVSRVPAERLAMPYRSSGAGFERIPWLKGDANMHAAGGVVSTASDMARWLEVNITRGRLDGRRVLPEAPFAEAHRQQAATSGRQRGWTQLGYGFGWQIARAEEDTVLVHGGGFAGFATHMSFIPAKRVGIVVMANDVNLGSGFVDVVAQHLYRGVLRGEMISADTLAAIGRVAQQRRDGIAQDRARRAARPQTLPHPLSTYAGVYQNAKFGRVELRLVGGALEARFGNARSAVEVYDHTRNQLRVELTGGGSVMEVSLADGRADALSWQGEVFRRVAVPNDVPRRTTSP